MKAFYCIGLFIISTLIFFTNCSSSKQTQKESSMQNEKFTAGSDSTDYGNHTYNSTQLAGKALFIQYCNRCHPAGKGGKGPSLIDKKPSEFRIHWQVRLGFGPMPSFKKSKISKEQLDQIISFVKLIGKRS